MSVYTSVRILSYALMIPAAFLAVLMIPVGFLDGDSGTLLIGFSALAALVALTIPLTLTQIGIDLAARNPRPDTHPTAHTPTPPAYNPANYR